jgi:TPR repeat protein
MIFKNKYQKYKNKYNSIKKQIGGMEEVTFDIYGKTITTNIYSNYICPISKQLFDDPVMTSDGITYERWYIEQQFSLGNYVSSVTRKQITGVLITNFALKGAIQEFKEQTYKRGLKKEISVLERLATSGDCCAQYQLGLKYYNGEGLVVKNITKALELLKKSSNSCDQSKKLLNSSTFNKAIYMEGMELYNKKDYKDAIMFLNEAVTNGQGYTEAENALGNMYRDGSGVLQDQTKALHFYTLGAKHGNANSQYNLGNMYKNGIGTEQNIFEAFIQYSLAAEQKHENARREMIHTEKQLDPISLNKLGNMYRDGQNVKQDYEKAVHFYKLGSALENSDSQYNLGNMFKNGLGVKPDIIEAIKQYSLAIKNGHKEAQDVELELEKQLDPIYLNKLGNMYRKGEGLPKDYARAVHFYARGARYGDVNCQINLGDMYKLGLGVTVNYEEAIRLYRLAAEKGDVSAQYYLGNMYENGQGIKQNIVEAVQYYHLAAAQGNKDALKAEKNAEKQLDIISLNKLGNMYRDGQDVKQDYEYSVHLYKLGAERGNAESQFNLGNMLKNGLGIKQDIIEAERLYNLAATQGYKNAQIELETVKQLSPTDFNKLGNMYLDGKDVKKDYSKAVHFYTLGATLGNAEAQYNLGNMYKNGLGIKQDYAEAEKFFLLAIKQNNIDAMVNLGQMYENGVGVVKDESEAVKLYKLAVTKNNAKAQFILGNMYEQGKGVEKNITEALRLYRLAAAQSNTDAQCILASMLKKGIGIPQSYSEESLLDSKSLTILGKMYEQGNGVKENTKKAVELYIRAGNNPDALYNLANIYMSWKITFNKTNKDIIDLYEMAAYSGNLNAQKKLGEWYEDKSSYLHIYDLDKSALYYNLAAKQGDVISMFKTAKNYKLGRGIKQDNSKVIEIYHLLAKKGEVKAERYLGDFFAYRLNNYCEAIRWYRIAIDHGDAESMCSLGDMYLNGIGVKEDDKEAFRLYLLAEKQEYYKGIYKVGLMYEKGMGVLQNYEIAAEYYNRAVEKDDVNAMYRLGKMYEQGRGVDKDIDEALFLYYSALEENHPKAADRIEDLDENPRKPPSWINYRLHNR